MLVQPPCKNCSDRCYGCHSTCDKYNNYRLTNANTKKELVKATHLNRLHRDYLKDQKKKRKR